MKYSFSLILIIGIGMVNAAIAGDTSPTEQLKYWTDKAGGAANQVTGKIFLPKCMAKNGLVPHVMAILQSPLVNMQARTKSFRH